MPASVAHAYFASDVYDTLSSELKNKLSLSRLRMFGQSTDSFLFYRLLRLGNYKKIRRLQHISHTKKTRDFFITLIKYIKENNLKDDIDTCSFLSGFICHYALDLTVHPYVFYKTGSFHKDEKETYKYNSLHTLMEVYLDNYLIWDREKSSPYNFPIASYCFDLSKFSESLNKTIRHTFKNVYNLKDADIKYYESLEDMKFYIKNFREDKLGIKKLLYKCIDTFTSKKIMRFEYVSYHVSLDNKKFDFLNFHHHIWRNPINYSMTSRESFYDLYLKALKLAKGLIEDVFSYLDGKDVNLEKLFLNLSYTTGLDCDLKKRMKYFEF